MGIGILLAIFLGYGFFFKKPNVVKPKVGPIVEAIYALGTVKSDDIYILKLGITSGITQLFVSEGDIVQKGQKLIVTESSTLTSPISGTVTRIYLDKGETVMPGIPVLTVMDLTKTFIQISLDQSLLHLLPGYNLPLKRKLPILLLHKLELCLWKLL